MFNFFKPKKVHALGIVAHPDDESFLFAGTSLKFADEGKEMVVICATKGEKGHDRLGRNLSEDEMATLRVAELKKACSILHCRCENYFKYQDGGLDKVDNKKLVHELTEKIEHYQPEIILTFGPEGVSGHRDHIVIGKAAVAAANQSKHKVKEIWLSSMPASSIAAFNEHLTTRKVHHTHFEKQILEGVPDDRLLKIDIEKYAEAKHLALKAHESQYLPHFFLEAFSKYECYEVIKMP
ncbi:MAG: PIG-L family deacetylase [Candidatus Doudnabacteria bacterium]|nr:PIG-L family deacetylase [Candidatus Doudnabacteria bacterium]